MRLLGVLEGGGIGSDGTILKDPSSMLLLMGVPMEFAEEGILTVFTEFGFPFRRATLQRQEVEGSVLIASRYPTVLVCHLFA